ncbi:hypothetical protein FACS1894122_11680 [Alphaproteobacteria bacterium]|nr:hypothetical protein FACS1894122_11680 [Alphaproteobacteria bacterium]
MNSEDVTRDQQDSSSTSTLSETNSEVSSYYSTTTTTLSEPYLLVSLEKLEALVDAMQKQLKLETQKRQPATVEELKMHRKIMAVCFRHGLSRPIQH